MRKVPILKRLASSLRARFIALPFLFATGSPDATAIVNHLIIKDYTTACAESERAFNQTPSEEILELYIEALAKQGNEEALFKVWNQEIENYPALKGKREVLEQIAWGIINKGYASSSPLIRIQALIAAAYSQDAKGATLLHRGMHDQSALIRRVAIKLAVNLRDAKLQDQIVVALNSDKNYDVRLAAIEAVGGIHIHAAKEPLLKVLAQSQPTLEETEAAVAALIEMTEAANRGEVERLTQNPRYGMRLLGCAVINALGSNRDIDLVEKLVNDPQPSVRAMALRTLGILRGAELEQATFARIRDSDPRVAIIAAWGLTIASPERGMEAFAPWLSHEEAKYRHFAAAALRGTGRYGIPAQIAALNHPDPLVAVNVAIGLISQRKEVERACRVLATALRTSQEKWEVTDVAGFPLIRASEIAPEDGIASREAGNQMARLEILNILAFMHYPEAFDAVRTFLKERHWGISGMAASLLLTEGDESALDIVEALIVDTEPTVRTQAALILSLWGRSEKAVQTLEKSYAAASRDMKEHILEGLGRVGSLSSVPFLVERLQEPFQSLRLLAASALLECLYH